MKTKQTLVSAAILTLGCLSLGASAEPVADFKEAVTKAILHSPRVNASWYNFEAVRESERAARGGYLPSVDVTSELGREDRDTPLINLDDYSRDASRLSVTQMLFDGFATREEVKRLGYSKLSQYYDLQRASQETALEATQAYMDTVRFQQLVKYAEDNYVVHRQVYDKIAERTGGGVSQGVDLEQASARIALAESNLLTEMTNLHDVQTRFQRIVGAMPADGLPMPTVPSSMIPELREAALNMAYERSPEIDSAIENLRASQAALNATNAPMMPRLDLRYRNEVEHDTDGIDGQFTEEAVELVVSYNLFRGGADSARKREYYNLYNAAIEERKQACLNVRQNTMISFNDIKALEQQVLFLDRNRISQDKTRRAYLDQFDLGQRTLLDLLDSQNEYFDTQRAYVAAEADLRISQAATLSNMGVLLNAMAVNGVNEEQLAELELDLSRGDGENSQGLCPPEAPTAVTLDKEALFAGLAATSDRYQAVGDNVLKLELLVTFALNSSVITSDFDGEIGNAAQFLKENPNVKATVEGHTDNTGTPEYNLWLSDRRAHAVRKMMIEDHGVDASQISAIGVGQEKPAVSNDTVEGRMANRRVELILDGS
jgi:adhesin transport system outer membrane protein